MAEYNSNNNNDNDSLLEYRKSHYLLLYQMDQIINVEPVVNIHVEFSLLFL